jgi:predicted transposase YbfD/YdcC
MAGEASKRSLIDHFSALKDPRQAWKVIYPLPEILLLVLCATLAGAEDFVEARLWGVKNLDFLRRFLPFKDGLPSHDTLNDVINALAPPLFKTCFVTCFVTWVEGLRATEPDLVAIDGKTSRRTHNRAKGREPLHLVSAWAARQRLVLGQEATNAKSNEITAIPRLLERLALTGALVTLDAMGCQTKIAEAIQAKGADYLIAVKDNWPNLHGEIERYFEAPPDSLDRHATTDGDHGRIEIRRHVVSHDVAWLSTDCRFPGEPRFPGRTALSRPGGHRPGRGRGRAGRQDDPRAPVLSLVGSSRCPDLRPCGSRPLGHCEPAALGHGRGLPRRPRPLAHGSRPREHGHRQTHGHEPRPTGHPNHQPQKPPQARRMGPRLPRNPHPTGSLNFFKRFPCTTSPNDPACPDSAALQRA